MTNKHCHSKYLNELIYLLKRYFYLRKMMIYLFLICSKNTMANFGTLTITALYNAVSFIY